MKKGMKIFLGSDHAGFFAKNKMKKYLDLEGYDISDIGPFALDEKDDYPDYAFKVGEKVARSDGSKGILVCGSANGMAIAANKVKRIRAVSPGSVWGATQSREHNDANVLALGAKEMRFGKMKKIAKTWLETKFSGDGRHKRRIRKIEDYEK